VSSKYCFWLTFQTIYLFFSYCASFGIVQFFRHLLLEKSQKVRRTIFARDGPIYKILDIFDTYLSRSFKKVQKHRNRTNGSGNMTEGVVQFFRHLLLEKSQKVRRTIFARDIPICIILDIFDTYSSRSFKKVQKHRNRTNGSGNMTEGIVQFFRHLLLEKSEK
jgi:hypothetical protein